jgi:hypothetical protein
MTPERRLRSPECDESPVRIDAWPTPRRVYRTIKLPRLDPDSANTCPHPMTEIIDYLRIEADPDEPSESELLPTEDL